MKIYKIKHLYNTGKATYIFLKKYLNKDNQVLYILRQIYIIQYFSNASMVLFRAKGDEQQSRRVEFDSKFVNFETIKNVLNYISSTCITNIGTIVVNPFLSNPYFLGNADIISEYSIISSTTRKNI